MVVLAGAGRSAGAGSGDVDLVDPVEGRRRVAGEQAPPLSESDLVGLALAEAIVAALLGFRLATLRTAVARDAAWSAVSGWSSS